MEAENHYRNNAMTDLLHALLQNDIEASPANMETCTMTVRGLVIAAQPDGQYVVTYPEGHNNRLDLRSLIDELRLR